MLLRRAADLRPKNLSRGIREFFNSLLGKRLAFRPSFRLDLSDMGDAIRRASSLLDRRLDKPLLALQAAMNGDALIKAVFRLLKGAIQCDFVNLCLRNVQKDGGTVAYRMIDSRGREFSLDLLENVFFRDHPGMSVLMANPGIRFINTREVLAPDAILRESRYYREVMQVIGFRHAVGMFFWDDPPGTPEAIFSVYREEGHVDFDDAGIALLDRLYPHVDAALRRVRVIEKERSIRKELHSLARRVPRSTCILDWDLQVADANRAARESCAQWNLGPGSALLKPPPFSLPAPLRDACAELKGRWLESLRHNPMNGAAERMQVRHPEQSALRASIALRLNEAAPMGKPGFLIQFERTEPQPDCSQKAKIQVALDALSERERKIVRLVCEGHSNQEIATHTCKALGSLKNMLHVIFKKLHVHSRANIIAQLGNKL
jgi:DNA-binding CsgD family transcriptional regulator